MSNKICKHCGLIFNQDLTLATTKGNYCPDCGFNNTVEFCGVLSEIENYSLCFPAIGKVYQYSIADSDFIGTCIGVEPKEQYAVFLRDNSDKLDGTYFCDVSEI